MFCRFCHFNPEMLTCFHTTVALSRAHASAKAQTVPFNSTFTFQLYRDPRQNEWDLFWAETHPPSKFADKLTHQAPKRR